MEILVAMLIGFLIIFILSLIFDRFKAVVCILLSVLNLLISFTIDETETTFILYGIVTWVLLMVQAGAECFNSDTKGNWIGSWNDDFTIINFKKGENHPVSAFFGSMLGFVFFVLIIYGICHFFSYYELTVIIAVVEIILSLICGLIVFMDW